MLLSLFGIACSVFACTDLTSPLHSPATRDLAADSTARTVVVTPTSMQGWKFYDDQHDTTCTVASVCGMVQGPDTPPAGTGSAELATPLASDGKALLFAGYGGTRLDHLTALGYSTYRQSTDPGNNQAVALQVNVDYDLTDAATGYQGRLVYEPYQGNGGGVSQGAWQRWDAKAGLWWGTKTSVPVNGVFVTNHCVQATPCTWAQVLAAYPNIGVHATYGAVVLKAGAGWVGFRGNVDKLTMDGPPPLLADADGKYPIPQPGIKKTREY